MTVYELRAALFAVDNQDLTVSELREKLFDLDDSAEISLNLFRENRI